MVTYKYEASINSIPRKIFGLKDLTIENEFILPHYTVARVKFGPFTDGDTPGSLPAVENFGPRLSIPLENSTGILKKNIFYRIYCIIMGLLSSNLSDYMYTEGYNDAMKHLIPAMSRLVAGPTPNQSKSNGNQWQNAILLEKPINFSWSEKVNTVLFL